VGCVTLLDLNRAHDAAAPAPMLTAVPPNPLRATEGAETVGTEGRLKEGAEGATTGA
jgi:hypothetical protein